MDRRNDTTVMQIRLQKNDTAKKDVDPYVYMMITAMVDHMILAEDGFIAPQAKPAKEVIQQIVIPHLW